MASQGPLGCGDQWTEDTSVGSQSWLNPDGALSAEGGSVMSCQSGSGTTYRVMTYNHGFTIPVGATITGIATRWRVKSSCFLEGTSIRMADGSDASIEMLEAGDEIKAFNEDMTTINTKIKSINKIAVKEYYLITTTKRMPDEWEKHHDINKFNPTQIVKVTGDHPFFTKEKKFVMVKKLQVGDKLYTSYSRIDHIKNDDMFQQYALETILSIELIEEKVYVFDIMTEGPHTFIANNFWVHNKGLDINNDVSSIVLKSGAQAGDNLAVGDYSWDSSGYTNCIYGGDGELWNTTWSVAEINDSSFGAGWHGVHSANAITMDWMEITVYYTAAGGSTVQYQQSDRFISICYNV